MPATFPKSEKLCKKSEIDHLFKNGKVIKDFPLKMIYIFKSAEDISIKAAFSIPKKKHRKAVDRNLLKRRMREAYRLSKSDLKEKLRNKKTTAHVFFIYLSAEKLKYKQIEDKIMLLLHRLESENEKNCT